MADPLLDIPATRQDLIDAIVMLADAIWGHYYDVQQMEIGEKSLGAKDLRQALTTRFRRRPVWK